MNVKDITILSNYNIQGHNSAFTELFIDLSVYVKISNLR